MKTKIYTISGRTTREVLDSTINLLLGYYQVNNEVMEKDDKINHLENIIDLIEIKQNII